MDGNAWNKIKSKEPLLVDFTFYLAWAAVITAVFCYSIFSFKASLLSKKVNDLDSKIAGYGTQEQKQAESEYVYYKQRIDAFSQAVVQHKISSNLFAFIEEHTVPTVWFSSFVMAGNSDTVRLSGQADTMAAVSRQVAAFEESKQYIKTVQVLDSKTDSKTKQATFTMTLVLDPSIFNYRSPSTSTGAAAASSPNTATTTP